MYRRLPFHTGNDARVSWAQVQAVVSLVVRVFVVVLRAMPEYVGVLEPVGERHTE